MAALFREGSNFAESHCRECDESHVQTFAEGPVLDEHVAQRPSADEGTEEKERNGEPHEGRQAGHDPLGAHFSW